MLLYIRRLQGKRAGVFGKSLLNGLITWQSLVKNIGRYIRSIAHPIKRIGWLKQNSREGNNISANY
jgi:hypothetical protein